MKHGNYTNFSVVGCFFQKIKKNKKKPVFFRTKLIWVGARSGLRLGLELVSKVVFGAFFESSLLVTRERHVGHTKFPDVYPLS